MLREGWTESSPDRIINALIGMGLAFPMILVLAKGPQRREERREKKSGNAAWSVHLSVTNS
jgi:hypothetical protein